MFLTSYELIFKNNFYLPSADSRFLYACVEGRSLSLEKIITKSRRAMKVGSRR